MNARLEVTTPSACEIQFTRDFAAPRGLVFDCVAKPEFVRQWLLGPPGWSMPVCEIDFRVGGRFRYVWRNTDGRDMGMGGVYREIVRPERIVHTERFDDDWTGGETTVVTRFTERNGITAYALTVRYASQAARDGALRTGMTEGMDYGYAKLEQLLASLQAGAQQ